MTIDISQLDGVATAASASASTTTGTSTADGWHVDDLLVRGAVPVEEGLLFRDGFGSGSTSAWSAVVP